MLIIRYKGFRIYEKRIGLYDISYMYSFDIWKRNIKSVKQCKNIITRAIKTLKSLPIK
jgi:hypothetical protein